MRKTTLSLILITSLASVAVLAAGNVRYKWRDAEGNLHYTDSLPTDANVRGYDVISGQGVLVKRVEAAKTPEQLAEAKTNAAAERESKDAAEKQQREDEQLLAANPSEDDLKDSQKQQIEMIDLHIASMRTGLQSSEYSLTDLLGRAAEMESSKDSVSAKLAAQISDVRAKIESQYAQLNRRLAERDATIAGFGAELDRYRALREKYKQH